MRLARRALGPPAIGLQHDSWGPYSGLGIRCPSCQCPSSLIPGASGYIRASMVDPLEHLGALNPSQRAAAEYGSAGLPRELPGPLLIIAGAGTGKTNTLAHRVARLIVRGAEARRILLLTFTRRAAETMTRRAE